MGTDLSGIAMRLRELENRLRQERCRGDSAADVLDELIGDVEQLGVRHDEFKADSRTLRAMLEYVPAGVLIFSEDLKLRHISRFGREVTDPERQLPFEKVIEELGRMWRLYYPDGHTPIGKDELLLTHAIREGRVSRNVERVAELPDGRQMPILCNVGPICDESGRIVGAVALWNDISMWKAAQRRLQESEQRYRSLYSYNYDGIFATDLEGRYTDCNPAAEALTGYSRDELRTISITDLVVPYQVDRAKSAFAEVLEGAAGDVELTLRRKDGMDVDVLLSAGPIIIDGRKVGAFGITKNITERKQAEEEIRRLNEQLERRVAQRTLELETANQRLRSEMSHREADRALIAAALANSPIPTLVVAHDGQIRTFNCAARDFTGYSGDELPVIEMFIERLFTDDDQRARVETDRRRIRSGEGFEGAQYVILRKDGQSRCVDFHFSSFSGGYVIQMLDVTEAVRAERSLRESEHRFRMIVETFPGMVWITRNDGNYTPLYLSEHCREIFGYPAEDFLEGRQRFVDLVLEEDRSRVDEAVEQMIATRRFYDIELRFRRADGEIVWVHEIGGGVWDERDELVYLTGSMLDVTERKRAEQELRQREELLDAVFEASRDCIVVWSPEGQHLYVNAAAGHYLGSRPDRIVGRSIEEVLDRYGDVARLWRSRLKTVLRVQQQMRFEDENLLDGRTVCSESTLSPLRGANGQVFAVALVYRDVTSRRQMEQELRESERRYRSLFDRMPVGLYRTTPAGKVLDANPTLIEMLGHPDRDSLLEVGAARWSYVNPGDRDRWQRQIQAQGILRDFETRLRRYDGSVIWVRDTARSVHDPSGRLLYYEGFMEDITAWKQAQQETRRYQQRLQELALELSLAEERERRRLAGELHDGLGQMLVLSKIKLDLIRHADTPEDRENQIQNAMDLMDQSVAMSRSLTLQLSNPALYQFGFVAGAKWLTDDMKKLYGLRVRLDEDEHHKPLDERISVVLFRCLRELLINVAKHAEANEAEVKILRCEGCVRVIVSDCGKGFDAKRLAEFDRQGFGLFSISERIESLGGRMSIHSIPGEGTRVTLEVPLTEEASQTS